MSSVNSLATQVAAKTYDDESLKLDPIIIAIIAQLIPILLELFEDRCEMDVEQMSSASRTRRPLARVAVAMNLRRQMGIREFREAGGSRLADAMLDVASNDANIPLMQAALEDA